MGVIGSQYNNMSYRSFNSVALGERLPMSFSSAQAQGKPTALSIGANSGFSMPIYNTDDEEIFFTTRVPRRWDGTTNPVVTLYAHLGNSEDVGDKFNFQLSYTANGDSGVLSATTNDVPVETTVITGRAAQYARYLVTFTLDATKICNFCEFKARLRRLAASGNEVSNEIIVTSAFINFKRNKLGASWS